MRVGAQMDEQLSGHDHAVWQELCESLGAFLAAGVNRVALLRAGLHGPQWACAVRVLALLNTGELQQLLDELVSLSLNHGLALTARRLIASLPRAWVLAHIEAVAEPYLSDGA